MTKKRSVKKTISTQRTHKSDTDQPMPGVGGMEKMMADLTRMLNEQNFKDADEANAFLNSFMASGSMVPKFEPSSPLEEAQDLIYDAWEARTRARRVKLARKALEISEDCADAYSLLAEEAAKSNDEAKALYEKAVAAGERAVGPEVFEKNVGDFWGILETRPYMRARVGLALTLQRMGQREEAKAHYEDMLRLNPDDNQGIRYLLAPLYLELEEYETLQKLLKQYRGDGTATWLYTTALLVFRQEGPGRHATTVLRKAIQQNPFVTEFLLGRRNPPPGMPEYVGFGDESEALDYLIGSGLLWLRDPAALDWLEQIADGA
jgi:tetratricopeptide (TPR) repeat protein